MLFCWGLATYMFDKHEILDLQYNLHTNYETHTAELKCYFQIIDTIILHDYQLQ